MANQECEREKQKDKQNGHAHKATLSPKSSNCFGIHTNRFRITQTLFTVQKSEWNTANQYFDNELFILLSLFIHIEPFERQNA